MLSLITALAVCVAALMAGTFALMLVFLLGALLVAGGGWIGRTILGPLLFHSVALPFRFLLWLC